MSNHNYQKLYEENEVDKRRVIELTREYEQMRSRAYELERNLQSAQFQLS
jgi:hypothetical protein